MNQYSNIYQILKGCTQPPRTQLIQSRLKRFKLQKDKLNDLLDFQRIEKIQQSVDQRMGPKLCDNSQQQSRQTKQSFLSILEDYKRQIASAIKAEKEQSSQLRSVIEQQLETLSSQFATLKRQIDGKIQQEKKRIYKISLLQNQMDDFSTQNLEHELKTIEHELQVGVLESQLAQRKSFSNMTSIMSSISLIQ